MYIEIGTLMDQFAWILWIILGVSLIIAEIFTLGFVLLWFGIGAIAAALVGMLGGGVLLQFLVFAVVSVLLTLTSRTLFSSYFSHSDTNGVRTNSDSMPGMIGTVTMASKGVLNEGAVKAYGSIWTAYPIEGELPLTEGEKVEVVEVRGSSIYVRKAGDGTKELPDWRKE